MSNTYKLTSEMHQQISYLAEQKEIFIKITGDYTIDEDGDLWDRYTSSPIAIQEKQIKQILVAVSDILGENPEFEDAEDAMGYRLSNGSSPRECGLLLPPKFKSQALYQKWLCSFPQSEFDTNKDKVLTELLEILKGI